MKDKNGKNEQPENNNKKEEEEEDSYLLKANQVRDYFKICPKTLYNWHKTGKIKAVKTSSNQYRYIITSKRTKQRRNICYCRVSTVGQKEDLLRQEEILKSKYPDYEFISDIGSGLNCKRKGFKAILEAAYKGEIETIVVTYKDRLCRFEYSIIEELLRCANGRIVVLYNEELSAEQELVKDLISIITCFSSKLYGLRSHSLKKQIKDTLQNNEVQTISN